MSNKSRKGARRTRRPHQDRVLAFVQVLEHEQQVVVEHAVPQASWPIDGLIAMPAEPSDGWGPLREHVADRFVVIEHYSQPPDFTELVRANTKLALTVDEWTFTEEATRHGRRHPLLLVLSEGLPHRALGRLPHWTRCGPRRTWRGFDTELGSVLVVNLRRVPEEPGNSVLRMFARPRNEDEARDRIAALLADERVLSSTRERITEAIMSGTIPSTRPERESVLDRIRREMREALRDEVAREVRDELRDEVEREVRDELRDEVAREVEREVRDELRDEVAREVRDELRDEVAREVRDELRDEVAREVRDEVEREVAREVRDEVEREVRDEIAREATLLMVREVLGEAAARELEALDDEALQARAIELLRGPRR